MNTIDREVRWRITALAVAIACLFGAGSPGPAQAGVDAAPQFVRSSSDGSRAFFVTEERLIAADRDDARDLYEWLDGRVRLVIRPGGALVEGLPLVMPGLSSGGERVVLRTYTALDPADVDETQDLYLVENGSAVLLTSGSEDAGAPDPTLAFLRDDGREAYFNTDESLVPGDLDGVRDAYLRQGGTTVLLTPNTALPASVAGGSEDGSRLFIETSEPLDPLADTPGTADIYERSAGTYTLISTGDGDGGCNSSDCRLSFEGSSPDGSTVYFQTDRRITADDSDGFVDIYVHRPSGTSRIGGGTLSGAAVLRVAADGQRILLGTAASLTPADDDGGQPDLYRWANGSFELVSGGLLDTDFPGASDPGQRFAGASADLSRVIFFTDEALIAADRDDTEHLYESVNGQLRLVGGARNRHPLLATMKPNGVIHFSTSTPLVRSDRGQHDVYRERSGRLTLLTGRRFGGRPAGSTLLGVSENGATVFFLTAERVLRADRDADSDIYVRRPGGVALVSRTFRQVRHPIFGQLGTAKGRNGRIVFRRGNTLGSGQGDEDGIWIAGPGGQNPREIVANEYAIGPTISPDGRRIAYTIADPGSPTGIYIHRLGGGTRRITTEGRDPEYLPDGRLAFISSRDGDEDLYAYSQGKIRRIGEEIGAASPDGRRVAKVRCSREGCDIYLYRRDGRLIKRLTRWPGFQLGPSFSPDGRRIVFVSKSRRNRPASPGYVVWVMRADGTRKRQVTRVTGKYALEPRFSPDGRFVVYTSSDTRSHFGPSDIFIARLRDGKKVGEIGNDTFQDQSPVWQAR